MNPKDYQFYMDICLIFNGLLLFTLGFLVGRLYELERKKK